MSYVILSRGALPKILETRPDIVGLIREVNTSPSKSGGSVVLFDALAELAIEAHAIREHASTIGLEAWRDVMRRWLPPRRATVLFIGDTRVQRAVSRRGVPMGWGWRQVRP